MAVLSIRTLIKKDYPAAAEIYAQGIQTGIATFETQIPDWNNWNKKHINTCRFVAEIENEVVGFGVLSPVSKRKVYKGVAEVSIYVSMKHRGKQIGETLLKKLITESEKNGFWTLQACMFSENIASINLHEKCGFRVVGIREKIGQLNGKWYNNHFLERRSKITHYTMKNILVLCTGNSCRSQMAHAYLNKFLDNRSVKVYSAGIETHGLNPGAVSILKEDGIDILHHTSNHVDEYKEVNFDFIITVCDHANENCPFIPSKNAVRLHQNFYDPSKVVGTDAEKHAAFLKAREEIKAYCKAFVTKENLI